jgi:hypothetical protein
MHAYYIWYFLIGGFLANGMPHFIWGISNTIARSPFGQQTKPKINFLWGLANFIAATLLSFWQIYEKTFTGSAVRFFVLTYRLLANGLPQFGFGIKRFLKK